MKTYQKITENSTKNSPKNKRTHQKILNRCCCNLHFILFRTHEGVTDTGIKFNLVIQMALQHILVQRFKQLLSERYLKLRNIRIQFEFGNSGIRIQFEFGNPYSVRIRIRIRIRSESSNALAKE